MQLRERRASCERGLRRCGRVGRHGARTLCLGIGSLLLFAIGGFGPVAGSSTSTAYAADRDCADFSTQLEAQNFFLAHGGPNDDPHRLDGDGDGKACEKLHGAELEPAVAEAGKDAAAALTLSAARSQRSGPRR